MHEISLYILRNSRFFVHQPSTVDALAVDTAMYAESVFVVEEESLRLAPARNYQAERATHLTVILSTRKLQLLASRTTYHPMSLLLYYETPPNSARYEAVRME